MSGVSRACEGCLLCGSMVGVQWSTAGGVEASYGCSRWGTASRAFGRRVPGGLVPLLGVVRRERGQEGGRERRG